MLEICEKRIKFGATGEHNMKLWKCADDCKNWLNPQTSDTSLTSWRQPFWHNGCLHDVRDVSLVCGWSQLIYIYIYIPVCGLSQFIYIYIIYIVMLETECFGSGGSIPCLLMPWLLKSTMNQEACGWLCRIDSMCHCFRDYLGRTKSNIRFNKWIYLLVIFKTTRYGKS